MNQPHLPTRNDPLRWVQAWGRSRCMACWPKSKRGRPARKLPRRNLPPRPNTTSCCSCPAAPRRSTCSIPSPRSSATPASVPIPSTCAPSAPPADCCRLPFAFKKHGQAGIEISELLPNLAALADDLCVVRSMYTFNPTHTPARSLFHSGNIAATRPSMGSWISYGLGTRKPKPARLRGAHAPAAAAAPACAAAFCRRAIKAWPSTIPSPTPKE